MAAELAADFRQERDFFDRRDCRANRNPNGVMSEPASPACRGNISYGDGVYKRTDCRQDMAAHRIEKDTHSTLARVWMDPREPRPCADRRASAPLMG